MADGSKTKGELVEELEELRKRLESSEGRAADLDARNKRLEGLCTTLKSMTELLNLEEFTRSFEDSLKSQIAFDVLSVSLLRDERHWEHLRTGEIVAIPAPIGLAGSATDWVVRNRKPIVRQSLEGDKRFRVSERTLASGIRSDVILPLVARGDVIGTFSIASNTDGAYTEEDVAFLQPLADKISVMVDNARLFRDLSGAYRDLKLIYDRVSDLIFLLSVSDGKPGSFISVNQSLLQIAGFEEKAIIGRQLSDILPEESADYLADRCQLAIDEGVPVPYDGGLTLPAGHLTLEGLVTPIVNEDGDCVYVLGVGRNVTERKQTERELIRLERLHALEEMARGVAHNFNNILVGVLGYAQLIEMQSRDQGAVDNARQIVESALRAKDLVQRLNLSVGRSSENPPEQVDSIGEVVLEAIETSRPKWQDEMQAQGVSVAVVSSVGEVPPVKANPVGLHHILVNLISNAVDAMPKGGRIDVTTEAKGDWVHLKITDTGSGMSEDVQRRIFEPFFTTRQDVGSGLGLAMAYRTVTEWGGDIEVASQPGKGTTFTLVLPLWEVEPVAGEGEEGERGRILVVDDEWTVRQVLQRALKGFRLDILSRGGDALSRFEPGVYSIALIDLGIPGVPGNELASSIKESDPGVVTVLITGWEVPPGDPRLQHFDYHIRKPFGLVEIRELVERALGTNKA